MNRKRLFYPILAIFISAIAALAMVYQEYGPINEDNLVSQRIRQNDIVADFFYPKESNHLPLVVALAGSAGGFLPDKELQSLALHGYAVLSLAYFNAGSLPKKLESIPLEYFDAAINWAAGQSVADSANIILLGVSRGAELALLLASHNSRIKGVVAYSPGCFVLPNAIDSEDNVVRTASWSWKGKDLSFAPMAMLQQNNDQAIDYRNYVEPLLEDPDQEVYTIPIEKAQAAILLISGGDDRTWPAAEMATLLEHRLKMKQYSYAVRNVIFPRAGHSLFQLRNNYQVLSSFFFRTFTLTIKGKRYQFDLGGSAWDDLRAKRKARVETLQFLEQFK